jgi:VWFA-related protein
MLSVGKSAVPARNDGVPPRKFLCAWFIVLGSFVMLSACIASAQSNASNDAAASAVHASTRDTPEISSRDETTSFKVKVNLVEVRVVVRDAKGNAVGDFKQQDFQLLDNGKPQIITKFSVEKAGSTSTVPQGSSGVSADNVDQPVEASVEMPGRFVAYLFDDLHLQFPDLAQARNAAELQLKSLRQGERVAIYTTSGQTRLDFTDDRDQLTAALNRIVPRSIANTGITPCPHISYYMADAIVNRNDPQALQVATADAVDCGAVVVSSVGGPSGAETQVRSLARRALDLGDQETRLALDTLQAVIRRIAVMPGQRTIILVSPGFFNPDASQTQSEVADRAVHSGVVISSLDAQGVYTNMPDTSEQQSPSHIIAAQMLQYRSTEQIANRDVLADFADATGGIFFHNNNDLADGFRRLAGAPEYSYLLAFSPQNLKPDGKYHKLKVTLKPPAEGSIQARKGYYAPKGVSDPSEQVKQAIQDAVFSQEEVRDIPVHMQTQFFKAGESDAKLSVLVHMDVRHFHFRKADGRNDNDVTVVSALFDRNGNFVSGVQKVLQLQLKDETLAARLSTGITLKSSFDVKPGSYVVRLVVRDEDGQLAAQSSAVQIP